MSDQSLALVERQITDIISDLDLHSYYQLLEVDPGAEESVITYNHQLMIQGYQQIQSHPQCSDNLRRNLVLLCKRLDEARRVLCDVQLRQTYDEGVELGEMRLGESTLHPITRRTLSGQLSLADFELEVPDFDPAVLQEGPSSHSPEPLDLEYEEDSPTQRRPTLEMQVLTPEPDDEMPTQQMAHLERAADADPVPLLALSDDSQRLMALRDQPEDTERMVLVTRDEDDT